MRCDVCGVTYAVELFTYQTNPNISNEIRESCKDQSLQFQKFFQMRGFSSKQISYLLHSIPYEKQCWRCLQTNNILALSYPQHQQQLDLCRKKIIHVFKLSNVRLIIKEVERKVLNLVVNLLLLYIIHYTLHITHYTLHITHYIFSLPVWIPILTCSSCSGLCLTLKLFTFSRISSAMQEISEACSLPFFVGRPDTTI